MRSEITATNWVEGDVPTGGQVFGPGFAIAWQRGALKVAAGPLGEETTAAGHNGAFVEDVIAACVQRLEFFQSAAGGKFACEENEQAIKTLHGAIWWLNERTKRRVKAGTEGTHTPEVKNG